MKKSIFTLAMIAFTLTAFSQNNYRDIVHLKNGSVIKGMIIEQVPNEQIKLETSDGSVFVYEMDEIEKMSKEKVSEESSTNNTQDFSYPTKKGTIIMGGSSNFSFSSMSPEDGSSSTEIKINPIIGAFISDNFAMGAELSYEDYESGSTFLFGPLIRYYFGDSNIKPFLNGEYLFGNIDYNNGSSDVNGFALGGGVAFFLNQHIAIDLGLTYNKISYDDSDTDGINVNGGFSIHF